MLLDDARSVKLGTTPVRRMMKNGVEVWPKTPVALTAVASAWDQVVLTIIPPMVGADSYVIKRGSTQIYAGSGLTFTDTLLVPSITYHYTVDAIEGGVVRSSGSASATTPARAAIVVTGSSSRWDQMALSWTDPSGGSVDQYRVKRSGTIVYTGTAKSHTDKYPESSLLPSTSYSYVVEALRGGAVMSVSAATLVTTAAYTVPVITLTSTTYENMQIRWAATDERSVDWYELWRHAPGVEGWTLLESEPASDKARDEGGLAENRTYEYLVRSFRGGKKELGGKQIGGDAVASRTTRTRSWADANGSHSPGYARYNDASTSPRYVAGNDVTVPNCTVTNITFWVWGYNSGAVRIEPHMGGISFGNDHIASGGQAWRTFNTNCYFSAGTYTTSMRIGGPNNAWYEVYGCKHGGQGALISSFGHGQWTGWVTPLDYTMPGYYPHVRDGVSYDGYIATHSCHYWYYPTAEDQPQMVGEPWWDESLADRATYMQSWSDPETGEITKVLITDYLTGEVLVDWEQGVEA